MVTNMFDFNSFHKTIHISDPSQVRRLGDQVTKGVERDLGEAISCRIWRSKVKSSKITCKSTSYQEKKHLSPKNAKVIINRNHCKSLDPYHFKYQKVGMPSPFCGRATSKGQGVLAIALQQLKASMFFLVVLSK